MAAATGATDGMCELENDFDVRTGATNVVCELENGFDLRLLLRNMWEQAKAAHPFLFVTEWEVPPLDCCTPEPGARYKWIDYYCGCPIKFNFWQLAMTITKDDIKTYEAGAGRDTFMVAVFATRQRQVLRLRNPS